MNKGDTRYHPSECPVPPSCNVYAIQNFTTALNQQGATGPFCSSEYDPKEDFPCPLIWLIHVVGDTHQPLHCGYGYDRGGNDVKVTFFGKQTELHAVWDTGMIYHYLDPTNGDWYDLYKYMSDDLKANPDRERRFAAVTSPVAWANESIGYVLSTVYDFDPTALTRSGDVVLGKAYYDKNFPIAVQRMEAAGVRLAGIINAAFAGSAPATAHFDAAREAQLRYIRKNKPAGAAKKN